MKKYIIYNINILQKLLEITKTTRQIKATQALTKIKMEIIKYNIIYKYNGECPGRKLPVKYFIKYKYIKINKN